MLWAEQQGPLRPERLAGGAVRASQRAAGASGCGAALALFKKEVCVCLCPEGPVQAGWSW